MSAAKGYFPSPENFANLHISCPCRKGFLDFQTTLDVPHGKHHRLHFLPDVGRRHFRFRSSETRRPMASSAKARHALFRAASARIEPAISCSQIKRLIILQHENLLLKHKVRMGWPRLFFTLALSLPPPPSCYLGASHRGP